MLSVVIPTFQRQHSLRECLRLLDAKRQGLLPSEYEVIISDDCPEGSAEALIKTEFPRYHWVKGPGKGPAANRNHGARHAVGEWLVFTDDDVLPSSTWLNALFSRTHKSATVLEGRTTCSVGLNRLMYEAPVNETGGYLWSCNFAIRRDDFADLGMFDERFPHACGEDEELRERIRASGLSIEFIFDAVVDHPPRRRPFGTGYRNRWKSQVLKERLTDQLVCADALMPLRVAASRLREIREASTLSDCLYLSASCALETIDIALRYRGWRRWARELAEPKEEYETIVLPSKSKHDRTGSP